MQSNLARVCTNLSEAGMYHWNVPQHEISRVPLFTKLWQVLSIPESFSSRISLWRFRVVLALFITGLSDTWKPCKLSNVFCTSIYSWVCCGFGQEWDLHVRKFQELATNWWNKKDSDIDWPMDKIFKPLSQLLHEEDLHTVISITVWTIG